MDSRCPPSPSGDAQQVEEVDVTGPNGPIKERELLEEENTDLGSLFLRVSLVIIGSSVASANQAASSGNKLEDATAERVLCESHCILMCPADPILASRPACLVRSSRLTAGC